MVPVYRLSILVLALGLCATSAFGQVDLCKAILAQGIFDTRRDQTKFTSYNHFRSVYCSNAASDYGSAKSIDATAAVPIDEVLVQFGLKANASDYNKWQSELCSSQDNLYSSDYWNSSEAKTASGKLLDAFNECVKSFHQGLLQYITVPSNDSKIFAWTFFYHPDSSSKPTTKVTRDTSTGVECEGPKTFPVGPEGHSLNCQRKDCNADNLIVNAVNTPYPPLIILPAISNPPPDPPSTKEHYAALTVLMNKPISDAIPTVDPSERCELVSGAGVWYAGGEGAIANSCSQFPRPAVEGGVASADFDNPYSDNRGQCTYTFKCWRKEVPQDKPLPDWCSVPSVRH